MKYTNAVSRLFFLYISIFFFLPSCSLNTKFDDADYRPVGASTPLNSDIHTAQQSVPEQPEKNTPDGAVSTRYIKPGTSTIQRPDSSTTTKTAKLKKDPRKKSVEINTEHQNILTQSIQKLFHTRYGNPDTIQKISKTVQIHCDNQRVKDKNLADTGFVLCRYTFPEFCGAHQFSVIFNKNKVLLMYVDSKYQRNIIDTLSGSKQSSPGLWDQDDYVSSNLLTISQLLNKNSTQSSELGWLIDTSKNEKAQLGRSYYAALKETAKCF